MTLRCKLVFDDWRDRWGESVYDRDIGLEASKGSFHHGSTFEAEIEMSEDDIKDMRDSIDCGLMPTFIVNVSKEADCGRQT